MIKYRTKEIVCMKIILRKRISKKRFFKMVYFQCQYGHLNRCQNEELFIDSLQAKKPDTNESEDSCLSTQDVSQINCQNPVCRDLLECDASVDEILPQLTSSMWMRGLNQLVRARNIRTVGQLAAMSEYDINSLPIREPKVSTTKSALASFAEQWKKKSEKQTPQKIKSDDTTKGTDVLL